tara:strand:- start:1940 stop:3517 length:1578 start_codon:yes stop_codon:yes gene_type:complete
MKIKKAIIKNFYSIENLEINLENYSGITLIEGQNKDTGGSNGSGKSSLVESFMWGLTGKTIRKSNEEALVNHKNKRKCSVELHLNDGIVIKRQKKPTFLELFVGDSNLTKESVSKTQEEIENLLGCNYKSLLCTSFFGQHNGFHFLDASPEDKRNIINNFLNLDYILDNRKSVKHLKSNYYQEAKALLAIIKEHRRSIDSIEKKKEKVVKIQEEYQKEYDEYALSLSLEDILKAEKQERTKLQRIVAYERQLGSLEDRKLDLEEKLKGIAFVCDKCNQDLPPVPTEEIDRDLGFCKAEIKESLREIDSLKESIQPVPMSSTEFMKLEEYRSLCRDAEKYDEFIRDLEKSIKEAEEKRSHQEIMYEIMKFWEKAFSEQGVIKYVIRNVLDYFNTRSNYYLSYLCDNHYIITFDEELTEKITSRGKQTQYISLSGGEKRRVNLAVLMALKDLFILNSSFDSNILFLDEIAENLDEKGVDSLYSLLQEIKKTKDIFVITHNKYLKSNLDSVGRISIIKSKGSTKLRRK